eukprot:1158517-Pelagomonas_calceolata.AAC.8
MIIDNNLAWLASTWSPGMCVLGDDNAKNDVISIDNGLAWLASTWSPGMCVYVCVCVSCEVGRCRCTASHENRGSAEACPMLGTPRALIYPG